MFNYAEITNDYFLWLVDIISNGKESSYSKLLRQLFETPFEYSLERDANRAHDGLDLRDRYLNEMGIDIPSSGPCSVLEMMIALAVMCEYDIMYNPSTGDRSYIWFWIMIENLGLSKMDNRSYDPIRVKTIITNFMNRNYSPDGRGSLFYVPGANDIRDKEIWYQMNTFLNSLIN